MAYTISKGLAYHHHSIHYNLVNPSLLEMDPIRPVNGLVGKTEYCEHALHCVMWGYSITLKNCNVEGNFNNLDFFRLRLKTVTSKQWNKFICSYKDKFDRQLFSQDLCSAGFQLFKNILEQNKLLTSSVSLKLIQGRFLIHDTVGTTIGCIYLSTLLWQSVTIV